VSKTKKIKRLQNQINYLTDKISSLQWQNSELFGEVKFDKPKFEYVKPPEVRSENMHEEQMLRRVLDYVYYEINKSYEMAQSYDPYISVSDLHFEVYMSHDVFGKLSCIGGYHHLNITQNGFELLGYPIIEVVGSSHVRLVRTK
jgi:hypothetical protein